MHLTHPTIAELTDHLLGEANQETDERVGSHLISGCEHCKKLITTLSRVRSVGRFDSAHRPPESAVRTVKALSGFRYFGHRPRRVNMRLSFDSLLSPAGMGARSLQDSSHHLVFYSQNFALDLRMDFERSAREVVVVGQLLNRDLGPLSDVPAFLVSGDQVVSHSTTGRLGEFHMECRPHGPMHLQLAVNDEELIEVDLDRRRKGDLRPVLVDRDDLARQPDTPPSIHSRSSDTDE